MYQLIHKDPQEVHNLPHAEKYGSLNRIITDGYFEAEIDRYEKTLEDDLLRQELAETGWNMNYIQFKNATYAIFLMEHQVFSLLSKKELKNLLPWIDLCT